MRCFRGMFLATILAGATLVAVTGTNLSSVQAASVQITVQSQAPNGTKKLDQMTQKLKKQCEDQGGTFVLESASAKQDAPHLGRYTGEGRLDEQHTDAAHEHPYGGTAYQASGRCTNSVTLDFARPPKP